MKPLTHPSQLEDHHTVSDPRPSHQGDIQGALGTIRSEDQGKRTTFGARLKTLLAILGPGLIVMVGDNDAGAFSTYTQAGQNYGTMLLWTLLALIPVLYVNQEMVLRLGAVTGVGHARLILQRFGKFWGAFSVIDLVLLNALTIVTEFIGISLALDFLGVPKAIGIAAAAALIMAAGATGSLRRFERFSMVLCLGSLCIIPVFVAIHPPLGEMVQGLFVPRFPGAGDMSTVMLLIIAIVGTTIAPWQLFFQQSYVIDKRITPRFINYERADLILGIGIVVLGAAIMVALSAATFAGHPEAGHFTDAGDVARGIAHYVGHLPAVFFAIALIDASIIGAAAISLSTAYAIGEVFELDHSLHHGVAAAPGFYAVYAGLTAIAAVIVMIPGAPLGLITNGVQTLAGILLPSATVFLLLLSNDKAILGPWANSRLTNIFTGVVVAVLVMLSVILTASVIFPNLQMIHILWMLAAGVVLAVVAGIAATIGTTAPQSVNRLEREAWRMPPLAALPASTWSWNSRLWLGLLRVYLLVAVALVIVRIIQIAMHY